jgi:hypothetical protein
MRPVPARYIVALSILMLSGASVALAQSEVKPPETFLINAQVVGPNATASAELTIHITRYTEERDRIAIQEALRTGGYPGFLPALRRAPEVGYVEVNGRKTAVRWARQQPSEKGRTISIVTDAPLAFVGGAAADAKPRAGYEVAVIQMEVDATGTGTGSMAAAARVKPGGATGVRIDDYADKPIVLAVRRSSR